MATPAIHATIAGAVETITVLYTDEPEPALPDTKLKTIVAASVTVANDKTFVAGGPRLVVISLAAEEIRPGRRFALLTRIGGADDSDPSNDDPVPAQLVGADGRSFFGADGRRFIPAPSN